MCNNANFADREFCNMRNCGAPRPEAGLNVPQVSQPRAASDMWTCLACGNMNFADRDVCNMRKCGTPRGEHAPPEGLRPIADDAGSGAGHRVAQPAHQGKGKGHKGKLHPGGPRGEEWTCSACSNLNFADRPFCNMRRCGAPRILEAWICEKCGNSNFPDRDVCNMRKCQAMRTDVPPEVVRLLTSKGKGRGSVGTVGALGS
eukprot:TRINITY_DN14352_c0_g1_i1.p1 TRINITY_DN14352_c0_g1~~TRINITY_DN14352_c0_g1_i1.p1  ORF type:complete len:202 (+),score=25.08 TRINITY_DN14352_c0_g1_i1:138-743(+)